MDDLAGIDAPFMRRIENLARELLSGKYPGGVPQFWDFELRLLTLQRDIQSAIGTTKQARRSATRREAIEKLQWARWQARRLGDAFAWLILGLNEKLVVPLTQNTRSYVSAEKSTSMAGVVAIAQTLGSNGAGMPILNDITDYLRIGDITFAKHLGDRKVEVSTVEVKTRALSEEPDADGMSKFTVHVHSVGQSDVVARASEQLPQREPPIIEPPPSRPDRRLNKQVRRMNRVIGQYAVKPNSLGRVDDASFISLDLRLENGVTHWDVVRRVVRRARRSGIAIEAADDAFAYVAVYDRDGDHSVLNTEVAKSHMNEFQRIMPPESERDGRDIVVINSGRPEMEMDAAYPTMPHFFDPLPKSSIFDLMHQRMVLAVPGRLQRADPRRVRARPADVHRVVPATPLAPVPSPTRGHRVLRPRYGVAGGHEPPSPAGRARSPGSTATPSRKNCLSTLRRCTSDDRDSTTSRTPSLSIATRSVRCPLLPGSALLMSTR